MERLRRSARTSSTPFLDMDQERETKIQLPQAQPTRSYSISSFVWRTLFLPAMGIIYLAFCYVCRYKIVEVGSTTGPLSQLPIIKAGVTSLSIIFVSLSLLPLSSLLSDLKSEEFFRALADKRQGVRLASLNNASTPSRGPWDSLTSLFRRQGSNYLAAAFLFGFIFLAASALAPAALSVDTVLFDGDMVALPIAAVPPNSVMGLGNFSDPDTMGLSNAATDLSSKVGSLSWAEVSLGVNYSFVSPTVDDIPMVVPMPVKLTPNITASWLSDVILLRPACEWVAPNILTGNTNFSEISSTTPDIFMNLDSKQIQVQLSLDDLPRFSSDTRVTIAPLKSNWSDGFSGQMSRFGTHDELADGTAVWMATQCVVGPELDCLVTSFGSPTTSIAVGPDFHSSRMNGTDGRARDFSFLVCTPNAEIQTRRIRNDGTGHLKVNDDPIPVRQGNLHAAQTKLLLAYLFKDFDQAGPKGNANITGLGNQPQISLLFGNNPGIKDNQLTLSPVETIVKYYGRFLQSGMKNFMDGSLGSTFVPSRSMRKLVVLSPSMPHVIASTVLYAVLSIFMTVCHFRRPYPHFTLSNVASSLEKSTIPPLFDQFNQSTPGTLGEKSAMAALGRANVVSEKNRDGSQVLKLRNRLSDNSAADHEMLAM